MPERTEHERDALTAIYRAAALCVGGRCDHEYDYQCASDWLAEHDRRVKAEAEQQHTAAVARIREQLAEPYDRLQVENPATGQVEGVDVVTVTAIQRALDGPPAEQPTYPAGHGWTPHTGPFSDGTACRLMLARYPCNYTREQHDPDLPPVDVDVFGYRRGQREGSSDA